MSKEDLLETILVIICKILDYTNGLDQRTPSIFDEKNPGILEADIDKLSTSSSSKDENKKDKNKDENSNTLHDLLYFWIEKLEFIKNLLLLAMLNLDKLLSRDFILTENNIKNVLFCCMITTQKIYEDEIYYDKDYAKIIDVSAEELVEMEIEFLKMVDFSLFINEEEFTEYNIKIFKMWKKTFSFLNFS